MNISFLKIVLKQIGSLLIMAGTLLSLPLLIAILYNESYSLWGLLAALVVTTASGGIMYYICKKAPEPENKHAFIIVALGYLMIAFFGALPFFFTAQITPSQVAQAFVPVEETYTSSLFNFNNPLHAFFESMSAYTTTGLTMAVHEPSIGHALLFYRSLAQWLGGAGFVVLTLAIFKIIPGRGTISLYLSEHEASKLKPTIIGTARAIWKIYFGLTLFSTLYLFISIISVLPDYGWQKALFDAVNHAMSGQSTGGFSTLDNSIEDYQSFLLEILHLLPMILGAIAIPIYYKFLDKKKVSIFIKDIQTRSLFIGFAAGTCILWFFLSTTENAWRKSIFQYISALSTTGWQTSQISLWPDRAIVFITCCAMFIGGSAGATVGGIKLIRTLTIIKGIQWQTNRIFFPAHAIKTIRFNKIVYTENEFNQLLTSASSLVFLYIIFILIGTLITASFMEEKYSITDAFFETASAQGTVGLSNGITHPGMSAVLECFYILQMWIGRLEIIPVMVVFRSILLGTDAKILKLNH